MGRKDGDPVSQKLLDESMRVPPSPTQIKSFLKDIGAPQHEQVAKLLADNGVSLVPVETPKRRSRSDRKTDQSPPTVQSPQVAAAQNLARTLTVAFRPFPRLVRYGKDCFYWLAVQGGGYLLYVLAFSIITGTSFIACIQFDLVEKVSKLRSPAPVVQREAAPPTPEPPPIETGSVEPPSNMADPIPTPKTLELGPWTTETKP